MNSNNRITYRFDRQGRQMTGREWELEEERKREENVKLEDKREPEHAKKGKPEFTGKVVPLYQNLASNTIDEIHPWESVYQEDISALETLIRESGFREDSNYGSNRDSNESEKDESDEDHFAERESVEMDVESGADIGEASSEKHGDNAAYAETTSGGLNEYWQKEQHLFKEEAGGRKRYRQKKQGPSWLNVFLSVAGALATGALFGYLILTLLTGGVLWPGGKEGEGGGAVSANGKGVTLDEIVSLPLAESAGQADQSGQGTSKENLPDKPAAAAASVDISGKSYSYTLLQFGVFSGAAGRDGAISQLSKKGFPSAVTKTENGFSVYAGIAADQGGAATIVSQLQGIALYKKELVLRTPDKLAFGGSMSEASLFFEETNSLATAWSSLIAAQLEQPSLSPLGETASAAWQQKYAAWTKTAATMKKGLLKDQGNNHYAVIDKAFESAAQSMKDYDKGPSKPKLWKAQAALLDAVLAQKEWFESTSAL
ncbi:hypothetical protein ACFQZE_09825 [Paenibacillus sp. GCM10027627]|uniref:hypothetical protein n=1 Tax=unclassified Paenibacillus TaxID=185978 RepID=UPI00363F058E